MKTCKQCHYYRIDGAEQCEVFDGSRCDNWQPMTNGDCIRIMSDAQLAKQIADLYDYLPGALDEFFPSCATDPETDRDWCIAFDCCHCPVTILKWLQGEVDYDNEDD